MLVHRISGMAIATAQHNDARFMASSLLIVELDGLSFVHFNTLEELTSTDPNAARVPLWESLQERIFRYRAASQKKTQWKIRGYHHRHFSEFMDQSGCAVKFLK
jgi:hypothetical protein